MPAWKKILYLIAGFLLLAILYEERPQLAGILTISIALIWATRFVW